MSITYRYVRARATSNCRAPTAVLHTSHIYGDSPREESPVPRSSHHQLLLAAVENKKAGSLTGVLCQWVSLCTVGML